MDAGALRSQIGIFSVRRTDVSARSTLHVEALWCFEPPWHVIWLRTGKGAAFGKAKGRMGLQRYVKQEENEEK